jgi:uncharacterized repeat protein (TIGR02543 family)
MDNNQYISGNIVTVIFMPEPTRANYKFIGWADSITTEPDYTADGTKTFIITGNKTLYAIWRLVNTITVTFDSEKLIATAAQAVEQNVYVEIAYYLDGQLETDTITILEGQTVGEFEVEGVEELSTVLAEPKYDDYFYYYAVTGDVTYKTVTYNSNGGSGTMQPQNVISGGNVILRTNTFTKTGEYFMGWATSAGGSVTLNDGATLQNVTENITLYAVWGYQITFNANGGQI